MNIKELLAQTEIWITADRVPIRLTEMDADHRRHTLAMLRRRAGYNRMMCNRIDFAFMRDAPDEVFDEWMNERGRILEQPADEWIERQPLIIELARLVKIDEYGNNVVDGEVVTYELEGPESGPFVIQSDARRLVQGNRGDQRP